jgi:hypothetical protein
MHHRDSKAAKNNFYPGGMGRLYLDKPFITCLTTIIDPASKKSQVSPSSSTISGLILIRSKWLHPTQHRVVSVREYARGQGFPDSFIFDMSGRAELAIRGIGNAVAVPVAQAIGREFFQVLVDQLWEEQRGVAIHKSAEAPVAEIGVAR